METWSHILNLDSHMRQPKPALMLGSGWRWGRLGKLVEAFLPGSPQIVQEQSSSYQPCSSAGYWDDDWAESGRTNGAPLCRTPRKRGSGQDNLLLTPNLFSSFKNKKTLKLQKTTGRADLWRWCWTPWPGNPGCWSRWPGTARSLSLLHWPIGRCRLGSTTLFHWPASSGSQLTVGSWWSGSRWWHFVPPGPQQMAEQVLWCFAEELDRGKQNKNHEDIRFHKMGNCFSSVSDSLVCSLFKMYWWWKTEKLKTNHWLSSATCWPLDTSTHHHLIRDTWFHFHK